MGIHPPILRFHTHAIVLLARLLFLLIMAIGLLGMPPIFPFRTVATSLTPQGCELPPFANISRHFFPFKLWMLRSYT